MTNLIEAANSSSLATQVNAANILFSSDGLQRAEHFALHMSKGSVAVPEHLRGHPADCLAVVFQAMQWGMNPFAVAQKTFMAPGGRLGYEAQLVNAALMCTGALSTRPDFVHFGNWERVINKFEMKKSPKGREYAVPAWKSADEAGLGVTVSATLAGERAPRKIDVLLSQCQPRNSTLWATDPQQQITYAALQKWARRNCPDAILGVYTEADAFADDPTQFAPQVRDLGTAEVVSDNTEKHQSRSQSVLEKAMAKQAEKRQPAAEIEDAEVTEDVTPQQAYDDMMRNLANCENREQFLQLKDAARSLFRMLNDEQKRQLSAAIGNADQDLAKADQ